MGLFDEMYTDHVKLRERLYGIDPSERADYLKLFGRTPEEFPELDFEESKMGMGIDDSEVVDELEDAGLSVDELEAAGLSVDELEMMDEFERAEALEEAGLDADDFDF